MNLDRIPRLYDDEADRLRVLVFVAALLLLPSLWNRYAPRSYPEPLGWPSAPGGGATIKDVLLGRRLDLNRAEVSALVALDGVGPAMAQGIVDDRSRRGPFDSVDALDRVKGIGPVRLRKLRPWLTVEPSR